MSPAPSAMHVARIVHKAGGKSCVTWLLRQSYRDGGKVKHHTLANLSALPEATVTGLQAVLHGQGLAVLGPDGGL